ADDLDVATVLLVAKTKPPAQRIFLAQVLMDELLIDHGHFRRRDGVALADAAPEYQRDAHGLKKPRPDRIDVSLKLVVFFTRLRRIALDVDAADRHPARDQRAPGHCHRAHAG